MDNPDPPKGGDHGKPTINQGKRKTMKTAVPNVVIVPPYDPYATESSSTEEPRHHFIRRQEEPRRQDNAAAEDTDSERTESESDPDSKDIVNSQAPSAQSVNQIIDEPSVNQNENIHEAEEGEVQQQVQPKPKPKPNDEGSYQGSNDVPVIKK